jgi:hypothetical protein
LDPDRVQQALQRELRRSVSPSLVVILGHDVGARVALLDSVEVGRDPACRFDAELRGRASLSSWAARCRRSA